MRINVRSFRIDSHIEGRGGRIKIRLLNEALSATTTQYSERAIDGDGDNGG